jgi:hypothetical protein
VRYQGLDEGCPERLRDWWAVDLWMNRDWLLDEDRLHDGLLRLVDAARSDDDFGMVAAGPIYDFINDDESRLAWIERQAAGSES